MSRDKQIEEMTIALCEAQHEFDKAWTECLHNNGNQPERENVFYAKYLIEAKGYRKASEVARDIFGNLRILGHIDFDGNMCIRKDSFEKLEKIFTEGEG